MAASPLATISSSNYTKSWTCSANNLISYATCVTPLRQYQEFMLALKTAMKLVPGATVLWSCDGTNAAAASDSWVDYTDIILATSGNRSHITVKFDNTTSDFTWLLTGTTDSATVPTQHGMNVSFNGAVDTYSTAALGSIPSATNGFSLTQTNNFLAGWDIRYHYAYSSDGKSFIFLWTTNGKMGIVGFMEGNCIDGRATTFDTVTLDGSIGSLGSVSKSTGAPTVSARIGGSNVTITPMAATGNTTLGAQVAAYGSDFPVYGVGGYSSTYTRFSRIYDLWKLGDATAHSGTVFPSTPAYLVLPGQFVIPWNAAAPLIY